MKIVSGQFKGRPITQPKSSSVRPMSEKVRAAVFDIAGPVEGLVVLDAYAGSGAVGLEAISRGAKLVEAIEADRKTAKVIEDNTNSLGVDWGYQLWVTKVETWLANPDNLPEPKYDMIVADPPYARISEDILDKLGNYLRPGGLMMVSHSGKNPSPKLESVSLADRKDYGDSSLSIYRR